MDVEPTYVEPMDAEPTEVKPMRVKPTRVKPTRVKPMRLDPVLNEELFLGPLTDYEYKSDDPLTSLRGILTEPSAKPKRKSRKKR